MDPTEAELRQDLAELQRAYDHERQRAIDAREHVEELSTKLGALLIENDALAHRDYAAVIGAAHKLCGTRARDPHGSRSTYVRAQVDLIVALFAHEPGYEAPGVLADIAHFGD